MKSFLILLAVIVVAVSLFFVFKSREDNEESGQVASFQVAVLDTDVSKKQTQEADFIKIEKEAEAFVGDQLQTSATGRATILRPNNTIASLGKNSTITLVAIDPAGGSKIKLEGGDIWSKIKRLAGQDYEVETENMVAAVRGTAFAVRFYGMISELFVLEGTVRAKVKDPKTGQIIPGLETEVKAGFKIYIDSKNLPRILADIKIKAITIDDLELDIIEDNLDTLDEAFELTTASPVPTKSPVQQTTTPAPTKLTETAEPSPTSTVRTTPTPSPTLTNTPTPVSTKKLEEPTPTPTPTPTPAPYRYYQLQNDSLQEVF